MASLSSSDITTKKNALIVVCQLSQQNRNKSILVKKKALKLLTRSLSSNSDEACKKHAVVALHQLVSDNDKRKAKMCSYHILDDLCMILRENPKRYSDLKNWALLLLHELSLTDSVIHLLIEKDVIYLFLEIVKLTFGSPSTQKLCFHSMVRIISSSDDQGWNTLI